ncbi:MAG: hypothetical protein NTX63_05215 [Candidatus Peregrinibacteria bacterium]|nr:hypothetical protein [Candidatus Peregrinibacteria bacterium]
MPEQNDIQAQQKRLDIIDKKEDREVLVAGQKYGEVIFKKVGALKQKIDTDAGITDARVKALPQYQKLKQDALKQMNTELTAIDEKNINRAAKKLQETLLQLEKKFDQMKELQPLMDKFQKFQGMFGEIPFLRDWLTLYANADEQKRMSPKEITEVLDRLAYIGNGYRPAGEMMKSFGPDIVFLLGCFIHGQRPESQATTEKLITRLEFARRLSEKTPEIIEERKKVQADITKYESKGELLENAIADGDPLKLMKGLEVYYQDGIAIMPKLQNMTKWQTYLMPAGGKYPDDFEKLLPQECRDAVTLQTMTLDRNGTGKKAPAIIPLSIEESKRVEGTLQDQLLMIRRGIYLTTKDPAYKSYFNQSQEKMTSRLIDDALTYLKKAGKEDPDANKCIGMIAGNFDSIQRMQPENPVRAAQDNALFQKRILSLKKKLGIHTLDTRADTSTPLGIEAQFLGTELMDLSKLKERNPEQHAALVQIIGVYEQQSKRLAGEMLTQNPVIAEFQRESKYSTQLFSGLATTFQNLNVKIEKSGEGFSEIDMAGIHKEIANYRSQASYKYLKNTQALEVFKQMKEAGGVLSANLTSKERQAIEQAEQSIMRSQQAIQQIDAICDQLLATKGYGIGAWGFTRDSLKTIAKIAAGVAGAVVIGGVIASTGGLGAGPLAFLATNAFISAGATIGSALGNSVIEQNMDALQRDQLLKSWVVGTFTSIGAGAAGQLVGEGIGGVSSRSILAMKNSRFASVRNLGQGMENRVLAKAAEESAHQESSNIFQHFIEETKEELLEEGLQNTGLAIAPDDPSLGFALSLLGTAYGHGKKVEMGKIVAAKMNTGKLNTTALHTPEVQAPEVQNIHEGSEHQNSISESDGVKGVEQGFTKDERSPARKRMTQVDEPLTPDQQQVAPKKALGSLMQDGKLDSEMSEHQERNKKLREREFAEIREAYDKIRGLEGRNEEVVEHSPENQKSLTDTMEVLREEIYLGMPPSFEAMWSAIEKSHLTLDQKKKALATVTSLLKVRQDTNAIIDGVHFEAMRRHGIGPGERNTGPAADVESTREKVMAELLAEKMGLPPLKGKIEYREMQGVLVIRCENNEDFARITGNHPSHLPQGEAFTPEQTAMGISMIVIRSDMELSERNYVVRHELQHIFKQGSNDFEPGRKAYHEYVMTELSDEYGQIHQENLHAYLAARGGDIQTYFKDEVLAFLRSPGISLDDIAFRLSEKEGGGYDYWNTDRDQIRADIAGKHPELLQDPRFVRDVDKIIQQERAKYQQDARSVFDRINGTIADLMYQGMSQDQARDHLADRLMFVPLHAWDSCLHHNVQQEVASHVEETSREAKESYALTDLKNRDPQGYEIIQNNDLAELKRTEVYDAILRGAKETTTNAEGRKVTFYRGKYIAAGGMGTISNVAFVPEGETKLAFGAIKRSLAGKENYFAAEVNAAKLIQGWSHPNIIKPLIVQDNFIIFESAADAMDLAHGLEGKDNSRYFSELIDIGRGIQEMQRRGYLHGDIKELNGLTLNGVGKVIDLTPVSFQDVQTANWPKTDGYYHEAGNIYRAILGLKKYGLSNEEVNNHLGRAIDTYAYAQMLATALNRYQPGWYADKKMVNFLNECRDALTGGEEGMMERMIKVATIIKDGNRLPTEEELGTKEAQARRDELANKEVERIIMASMKKPRSTE